MNGMLAEGLVGRAHRATEPLHSMTYFAPETEEELTGVGLRPGRMCYFAGRSAPMGAVDASVTYATFYNFNPELVARHIPRAWTLATPQSVVEARFVAADRSLRRLLGEDAVGSAELAELAGLLRSAAADLDPAGRTLFAAHAGLDWPGEPLLDLWHGTSLLREYRGDGHLAALLLAGLSGIEAIVTHCATGRGFLVGPAKLLRGWSDEQWAAAVAGLEERGLMAGDALTPDGVALRAAIEADTDRLDVAPWQHLGADGTARVVELGKAFSRQAVANGAFPAGVFA